MLKILAPGVHHDFLIRPGGRTIWRAYPSRPKPFKPYDTYELLQKLHAFGASARSEPVPAQRRIMMRDAAIMALMLMYGPRVSDAASMRLGFNLFSEVDGNLAVSFAGASTKGKRLLEYPLCSLCSAYINDYLRTGRP